MVPYLLLTTYYLLLTTHTSKLLLKKQRSDSPRRSRQRGAHDRTCRLKAIPFGRDRQRRPGIKPVPRKDVYG